MASLGERVRRVMRVWELVNAEGGVNRSWRDSPIGQVKVDTRTEPRGVYVSGLWIDPLPEYELPVRLLWNISQAVFTAQRKSVDVVECAMTTLHRDNALVGLTVADTSEVRGVVHDWAFAWEQKQDGEPVQFEKSCSREGVDAWADQWADTVIAMRDGLKDGLKKGGR